MTETGHIKMTTLAQRAGLTLLLTTSLLVTAGVSATTVSVTASLTMPTCTLSLPSTHNIGSMLSGTDASYRGLTIGVSCNNGAVSSRLYATVLSGTRVDASSVRMNGTGSVSSGNPPVLRMLDGSTAIALDGSGASSNAGAFCAGSSTRNCTLTPRVNIPANATTGNAKASLRLTLRYS